MKLQNSSISPGDPAPDFKLPLLGGGFATRASLLEGGRAAMLVFFKLECPTCRLAFPFFQRIYARLASAGGGAGFLAVAQNSAAELPEFLAKYEATFPCAMDAEPWDVSYFYQITNVPTMFLLDGHGVILRTAVGFNKKELDIFCNELLSHAGAAPAGSLFTDADAHLPQLQPG